MEEGPQPKKEHLVEEEPLPEWQRQLEGQFIPEGQLPADEQYLTEEQLILVDPQDQPCGTGGKLAVHQQGLLHRAFSIFVFDDQDRLLLQRRADGKYHFARLWSNTCCGHPRPGETSLSAAQRRLEEEFGFTTALEEFAQLTYKARDPASGLTEHEFLHVFRGRYPGTPLPNPEEISAWRWVPLARVERLLWRRPQAFTPWFALLFRRLFVQDRAG